MIRSFVVLSLMMSASVAVAKTSGDAGTDPAAKPVKEKKICRDSDDSTSRLARRVCRTVKQWEETQGSDKKAGVRSGGTED
jgi:hypothetical protein